MSLLPQWLSHGLGLSSVLATGRNAWLVIISRTSRMFAYGAASIFLALFFSALDFSDFQIGLFQTLTLLGDVVLTLVLTLSADKLGRRRTLLLGSGMMIFSGSVFCYFENFWVLLFAAVVGIISASGGDFGPFRAIEESILSQLTAPDSRSNVLSWYVTSASLGSAIGTELSGRAVDKMKSVMEWSDVQGYHAVFGLYIVFGLVNAGCVALLTRDVEAEGWERVPQGEEEILLERQEGKRDQDHAQGNKPGGGERKALGEHGEDNGHGERERKSSCDSGDGTGDAISDDHSDSAGDSEPRSKPPFSRLASISPSTRSVMFKLWPLLSVDSIADGMVNYSLTTYYISGKFRVAPSSLGDITSVSYFLAAISTVFAGPLANKLGLINTMVFTHVPSSAAVLLFPLPSSFALTMILLFIRTGLNNMDQAPRAAFIAAVVSPSERTAVNGMTSTIRTLSATAGPTLTGLLAEHGHFWVAFVAAGLLRLAYDFGLWALFVNMKLHQQEERPGERADGEEV